MGTFTFVFTGESGSGKTMLANMLEGIMQEEYNLPCPRLSFAQPIKELAKEKYGPKPSRAQFQEMGDSLVKDDPNCVLKWAEQAMNKHDKFVSFDDARRTGELQFGKDNGVLILVDTPQSIRSHRRFLRDGYHISAGEENHTTEQQVRSVEADYMLDNSGVVTDAKNKLRQIVMSVFLKYGGSSGVHSN